MSAIDEATFAKHVTEGKLSAVTVSIECGRIGIVTANNAAIGLRVTPGVHWSGVKPNPPKLGTLSRATSLHDDFIRYVNWDDTGIDYNKGFRVGGEHRFELNFSGEPTGAAPIVTAYVIGDGEPKTFSLVGDFTERLKKMTAWLQTHGFKQSGGDVMIDRGTCSVKVITFIKPINPF